MSQLLIFELAEKDTAVSVRLEGESVWLTQEQMAELFERERSVITKHLKNVFKEGELDELATCAKFAQVRKEGKRVVTREVEHYNLDAIISVGYRVNSKRGTQFRQWATQVLRHHLTQGWSIDKARFEQNALELESALLLIKKTALAIDSIGETGRELIDIISRYTQTFLLLQRYDEGLLTEPEGTPGGIVPTIEQTRKAIAQLKRELLSKKEAGELFGQERGEGLVSILNNLDQTVFGNPAYPTVQDKAAHLLYFIIKDHPLSDGNKRTAALLFVTFLYRNHALLNKDDQPVINDMGLTALTLLIAESAPRQKDTMINLIKNMLVRAK
jgi:prophage maintenance system killer protein